MWRSTDTCQGFGPSALPPTSPLLLPTFHPPPPLAPASPLFKSEAFLLGDVAEKFSSPCTRGFSSASEPAAFLNRFCHLPSPSVTPPSRRLELTSQTLRETPRDFVQKTVEQSHIPASWKPLIAPGKNEKVGM